MDTHSATFQEEAMSGKERGPSAGLRADRLVPSQRAAQMFLKSQAGGNSFWLGSLTPRVQLS